MNAACTMNAPHPSSSSYKWVRKPREESQEQIKAENMSGWTYETGSGWTYEVEETQDEDVERNNPYGYVIPVGKNDPASSAQSGQSGEADPWDTGTPDLELSEQSSHDIELGGKIAGTVLPALRAICHALIVVVIVWLYDLDDELLALFEESVVGEVITNDNAEVITMVNGARLVLFAFLITAGIVVVAGLTAIVGVVGLWMENPCGILTGLIINVFWLFAFFPFLLAVFIIAVTIPTMADTFEPELDAGLSLALASREFAERIEGKFKCCGSLSPAASYCSRIADLADDDQPRLAAFLSRTGLMPKLDKLVLDKITECYNLHQPTIGLLQPHNRRFTKRVVAHVLRAPHKPLYDLDTRLGSAVIALCDEPNAFDNIENVTVNCNHFQCPAAASEGQQSRRRRSANATDEFFGDFLLAGKALHWDDLDVVDPNGTLPEANPALGELVMGNFQNVKLSTIMDHHRLVRIAFGLVPETELASLPMARALGESAATVAATRPEPAEAGARLLGFLREVFDAQCLLPATCCPDGTAEERGAMSVGTVGTTGKAGRVCKVPRAGKCQAALKPELLAQGLPWFSFVGDAGLACFEREPCLTRIQSHVQHLFIILACFTAAVFILLIPETCILNAARNSL